MQRRNFILGSSALTVGTFSQSQTVSSTSCTPTPTPVPTPPPTGGGIDVVAEIRALRIPTGPYAGGFEIAPNGRLNWYFTNLGLLPIVQLLSATDLDLLVRNYLDLYIRSLTTADTIDDISFPFGRVNPSSFTKVASDSDDAYAATFLSLAVRYVRASRNWTWWEANKARIKEVAYRNLALTAKVSGLTSVFQAPRSQSNSIGYLMDNCEGYRGLRDLASLLRERGEIVEANYYDLLAANAANGMVQQTFNVTGQAFTPSDAHLVPERSFYPGTSCQVYPQAFGVSELAPLFDMGWRYLNTVTPNWEDGHSDPYPWAILGTVAAMRGQTSVARSQLASIEKSSFPIAHLSRSTNSASTSAPNPFWLESPSFKAALSKWRFVGQHTVSKDWLIQDTRSVDVRATREYLWINPWPTCSWQPWPKTTGNACCHTLSL